MEFTEKHELMLQETHDTVIKVSAVILDTNGNKGLASRVVDISKRQDVLEDTQGKIEGKFKLMVGILIGSGVLTGTAVAGIAKVIGG